MYTTSGLGLLPKVVLALASSTSESREEVLFDMLHSALTWSKDLAPPTPPSSPRTSSHLWSSDTTSQSPPSMDERKEDDESNDDSDGNDDENDDVDTKRCTNITNSIEDSNQKSSHQHYQRDPNLSPPVVTIAHALCQSLQKTLSEERATLPLDVTRALVVLVLAMTLNDEDEETPLGRQNISRDFISELLKTTRTVLNWKNAPSMDSKSRLQYRRLLSAFDLCWEVRSRTGFFKFRKIRRWRTFSNRLSSQSNDALQCVFLHLENT